MQEPVQRSLLRGWRWLETSGWADILAAETTKTQKLMTSQRCWQHHDSSSPQCLTTLFISIYLTYRIRVSLILSVVLCVQSYLSLVQKTSHTANLWETNISSRPAHLPPQWNIYQKQGTFLHITSQGLCIQADVYAYINDVQERGTLFLLWLEDSANAKQGSCHERLKWVKATALINKHTT